MYQPESRLEFLVLREMSELSRELASTPFFRFNKRREIEKQITYWTSYYSNLLENVSEGCCDVE